MAHLLTLRSWSDPVTTYTVGVAQTGQMTTTTIASVGGQRRDVRKAMTSLLAASVNEMCGTPGAGAVRGSARAAAHYPDSRWRSAGHDQRG